jgi:hypothetical protein
MMIPPAGAPVSALFVVEEVPNAGRGVYALCDITEGTPILTTDALSAHVIYREYRREVCGFCFSYDRGKNLKLRDVTHGFSFCSEECVDSWKGSGDMSMAAWAAVERLVKARPKEDDDLVDINAAKPTEPEIEAAWKEVENQASLIRAARKGVSTKPHRKAVQQAISRPVPADTLPLLLTAILIRYNTPEVWETILSLAPDPRPYKSADELRSHVNSYLHLLTLLPEPLLELTTPDTLLALLGRDSWNSFGIRSLDDGGSENFGYGVWPPASYFNHNCAPNTRRQRVGRTWQFVADRAIRAGEQLCISYISAEQVAMGCKSRMDSLRKTWGFDCACDLCASSC